MTAYSICILYPLYPLPFHQVFFLFTPWQQGKVIFYQYIKFMSLIIFWSSKFCISRSKFLLAFHSTLYPPSFQNFSFDFFFFNFPPPQSLCGVASPSLLRTSQFFVQALRIKLMGNASQTVSPSFPSAILTAIKPELVGLRTLRWQTMHPILRCDTCTTSPWQQRQRWHHHFLYSPDLNWPGVLHVYLHSPYHWWPAFCFLIFHLTWFAQSDKNVCRAVTSSLTNALPFRPSKELLFPIFEFCKYPGTPVYISSFNALLCPWIDIWVFIDGISDV